ncbi:hypothetical protein PINS_up016264 [Pythium insidiosum]|nr:hypothetical protein PINS_up016264 [Pythium insidiosum]
MQDDYLKLTDVVTSLRAALRHEQAARLKAMARVRRLEEIVTMKDRKIEALMQGNAVTATAATVAAMREDTGKFGYAAAAAFAQRELAQRDRQHHVLVQKLRQRLAEQTQLLATYESEMQTLRGSLKSAALLQLETECEELHLEIQRLHSAMALHQHELAVQTQHTRDAMDAEARVQQQLARAHEDHKRLVHDKRRLEQEVVLLRAHVDELERRVALEQRKRSYDHGFHTGTRGPKSPRSPPAVGTTVTSLAEALAEMRSAPTESGERARSVRRPTPALPHPPTTGERSSRSTYARRRSVGETDAGGRVLGALAEEKVKEEEEDVEEEEGGEEVKQKEKAPSPRHVERALSASSVDTTSTESTRRSSASTTAESSSASSTSASTASLQSVEASPHESTAAIDAAAAAMTKELQALGLLGRQESWLTNTELEDGEDEEEDVDSKVAYELDFMDT